MKLPDEQVIMDAVGTEIAYRPVGPCSPRHRVGIDIVSITKYNPIGKFWLVRAVGSCLYASTLINLPEADFELRRTEKGDWKARFVRDIRDVPIAERGPNNKDTDASVATIRVSINVQERSLIDRPQPIYPKLALKARIQGVVRFDVVIGTDGLVRSATLRSGDPLLAAAAEEALRGYRYRPLVLLGRPVKVSTSVEIPFRLTP